jgi:hypothetical protein
MQGILAQLEVQRLLGSLYFDVAAGLAGTRKRRLLADALVEACDRVEPLGHPVGGGGADQGWCGHG